MQPSNTSLRLDKRPKNCNNSITHYLCLLGILLCLTGFFLQKGTVINFISDLIPSNVENNIGDKIFEIQKDQLGLIEDEKINEQFELFANNLISDNNFDKKNYNIFISNNENINAYAMLGGYIIINKGLINFSSNGEELLGVIAHEIAHINNRHIIKTILTDVGIYSSLSLLFGDVSGFISQIIDGGAMLFSYKFSREYEKSADSNAIAYLIKANISPIGFREFFKKNITDDSSEINTIFNTHPPYKNRANYIENIINQNSDQEFKKIDFNLIKFKHELNMQSNSSFPI